MHIGQFKCLNWCRPDQHRDGLAASCAVAAAETGGHNSSGGSDDKPLMSQESMQATLEQVMDATERPAAVLLIQDATDPAWQKGSRMDCAGDAGGCPPSPGTASACVPL